MSPNPSTRENVSRNDILYMGDHPCGAGLATSHISYCYSFLLFKNKPVSFQTTNAFFDSPGRMGHMLCESVSLRCESVSRRSVEASHRLKNERFLEIVMKD